MTFLLQQTRQIGWLLIFLAGKQDQDEKQEEEPAVSHGSGIQTDCFTCEGPEGSVNKKTESIKYRQDIRMRGTDLLLHPGILAVRSRFPCPVLSLDHQLPDKDPFPVRQLQQITSLRELVQVNRKREGSFHLDILHRIYRLSGCVKDPELEDLFCRACHLEREYTRVRVRVDPDPDILQLFNSGTILIGDAHRVGPCAAVDIGYEDNI